MKKQILKTKLIKLYPPGYEWKQEAGFFIFLLSISLAWCVFGVWSRFFNALVQLKRNPNFEMPPFYEVLGNGLFIFGITAAIMLLSIALHYAHHRSGSKSIYLMRRLPDALELHRRCIVPPLAWMAATAILAAGMLFLGYGLYMLLTPDKHLEAGQLKILAENWNIFYWRAD